ncbi:alkaline phosphatase family protein [Sporolactobacillus pectinivorans]|uniref:alkaline phosphatase family protein n=1 Tax=Sporolactobacillus pectinivorans TaxID=1591408 RepID=UPI000C25C2BB|nr:alkaline phosphatase family protein [Sporolactobacillus pectinivorans]
MSNSKLVMVTLDGCRYDTAIEELGFLEHLVEKKMAFRCPVRSELPSNSRPMYEVLLTGTPPCENGIVTNLSVRLSNKKSVFSLVSEQGLKTAAAAYYWVSELFNRAPFDFFEDRLQNNEQKAIQHGMFYFEDQYPDSHLFMDAHYLLKTYRPDFLYVHSMNIDDTGHKFTSDSKEYRQSVDKADLILAETLPLWIKAGYQIIVTADHGIDEYGHHGGTREAVRRVPLYIISDKVKTGQAEEDLPQLMIAPLICDLLGIVPSEDMKMLDFPGMHENK